MDEAAKADTAVPDMHVAIRSEMGDDARQSPREIELPVHHRQPARSTPTSATSMKTLAGDPREATTPDQDRAPERRRVASAAG